MPTHAARANLSFSGKHVKSGNLSDAVNSFARGLSFNFIQGIGVGQVDLIYHNEKTFNHSVSLDLQNFTDVFNVASNSFATIRLFAMKNTGNEYEVYLAGATSPYKLPWQPDQGGKYHLQLGASMMVVSWETGWTVDADNADLVFSTKSVGRIGTVEFLIAGVAA